MADASRAKSEPAKTCEVKREGHRGQQETGKGPDKVRCPLQSALPNRQLPDARERDDDARVKIRTTGGKPHH
jgi:hypothetical protein